MNFFFYGILAALLMFFRFLEDDFYNYSLRVMMKGAAFILEIIALYFIYHAFIDSKLDGFRFTLCN